jgi:hypothetical protein
MDIHAHAAEFIMSLLIASTILIGLTGIVFIQIRMTSMSVNRRVIKSLRRVLYIAITLGVVVLFSCGVWFMTSVYSIIYFTMAAFIGQIYFFVRPAITYGSVSEY